jgi:phosphonate transport system substrate-binding protein
MERPLRVGAVMYDARVSVIWEIIRDFFESQSVPIDVSFYNSYGLQVSAMLENSIDIAWNSPLAWLDAQRRSGNTCRAIAMRDTDRDRISYLVVRSTSRIERVTDLRGLEIALGASDSPQATLIPLGRLRRDGINPDTDVGVHRCDVLVGKHGDHVGGELEAFRALQRSEVAACAMLDLNWDTWTKDGTIDPGQFRILAETDRFDHCVFTVRRDFDEAAERRWLDALFSMRYDIPEHREMMDLEGLRAWLPGRTIGFRALAAAVDSERFFENNPVES